MKKIIILCVIALFVGMCFTSISGIQIDNNIVILSYKGNILYVGGTGEGNYTSIQDAVDNASDGDTVFVFDDSSPYYERLVIDKSIKLIGEDRDTTVIEGNHNGDVIKVKANYVTVSGFTFQNGDGVLDAGIRVEKDYNYTTIVNNNFFNNEMGIWLDDGSSFNNVSGNNISYNLGNGIWISGGSDPCRSIDNVINGNIISNNRGRGIFSVGTTVSRTKIIKNRIFNNEWGGITDLGSNEEIRFNEIYSNEEYGIMFGSDQVNVLVSNNKIYNNLGYGIDFWGAPGNLLLNFEISYNHIESNLLVGIKLGWTFSSKIVKNNIYNNGVNARFISSFGNKWDGNYWGSPYKEIKLITGKILIIPWFNFDFHPAKEPYNYTTTQGCDIE